MAKYSREQRDRAVDLYVKYERCAADVIRELGYPSKGALLSWYADRLEEERTGVPSRRGERYRRYSDEQKRAAVDHYLEYGRRPGRTMRMLGYPKSKELLMAWIDELAPGRRRPGHGPVPEELKREAVVAVASGRLKSREAAAELGVEASVVGKLETTDARRIQGDACDGDTREEAPDGRGEESRRGAYGVGKHADVRIRASGHGGSVGHAGVHGGQTRALAGPSGRTGRRRRTAAAGEEGAGHRDRDPEGHVGAVGKRAGRRPGKARPAARRRSSSRPLAKRWARRPKVCCPWWASRAARTTPARRHETPRQGRFPPGARARGVREQQAALWIQADSPGAEKHGRQGIGQTDHEAHDRKRPGTVVQKREAARLVQGRVHQSSEEPGGQGFPRRTAEHAVGHGPHGVFHPRGQGVPVPVIDCYDGMPVAWTIGTGPDSALANGMLADACSTLKDGEKPIIHSDRGYHYRWPEWIRICEDDNLTRSMSAKGCSPDNAAAEGFFGRPRQEFFHKRSFAGVSMDGFINMLDDYMVWYRDKRIKTEFGMSIMDRRRRLGLVA